MSWFLVFFFLLFFGNEEELNRAGLGGGCGCDYHSGVVYFLFFSRGMMMYLWGIGIGIGNSPPLSALSVLLPPFVPAQPHLLAWFSFRAGKVKSLVFFFFFFFSAKVTCAGGGSSPIVNAKGPVTSRVTRRLHHYITRVLCQGRQVIANRRFERRFWSQGKEESSESPGRVRTGIGPRSRSRKPLPFRCSAPFRWLVPPPPPSLCLCLCLFPSPLSLSPLLSRGSSVEKATTCDVASDSALDHWSVELCPALGCLGCLH